MMDATAGILTRRSIRKFTDEPVSRDDVQELLDAAFSAPIGTREECRHFVALTGEEKRELVRDVIELGLERLSDAMDASAAKETVRYARSLVRMLDQAPVLIAVYMNLVELDEALALPSVAAAVQNLLLAAHLRGLGACWTTGAMYVAEDIGEHLGIMDKHLVALIPVGHPAQDPKPRNRTVRAQWHGFGPEADETGDDAAPGPGMPEWVDNESGVGVEVLVADDSPSARERIGRMLTGAGYAVRETDSLEGVLNSLEDDPPSLVVLDGFLAGVAGEEGAVRIHEAVNGYIPLLITSNAYHLEDRARALALGADGLVEKPVRWPDLLGEVRASLRTKRLYDDLAETRADLEQTMHHRQKLSDMIVHDLRSPLSGMLGTMEYILGDEDSRLDPMARELLQTSYDGGQMLLGMVNDLLDVSKMTAVGLPLDLEPVRLQEVAEVALNQMERLADESAVELRNEVPEDLGPLMADGEKLRRVLVNLLSNAVRFTPAGGTVTLSVTLEEAGGVAAGSVADTGIGIPEEEQERVFELFTQVDRDDLEQKGGTGLGLAFCKMVAESHGGSISVESELGQGSVFTVRLPVAGPEGETTA